MTAPSSPAFAAIWRSGASSARRMMADAHLLVGALDAQAVEGLDAADQAHAPAGHDALLDRSAGGVEGVLDAVLLLLELELGRRADLHDRHAALQLGEALLELLGVVVRGGLLDLGADLVDARLDVLLLAAALAEGRGVLGHDGLLDRAEVLQRDALELDAEVLADERAAGQDGDVLEHGLAALAEARRLDGADAQAHRGGG